MDKKILFLLLYVIIVLLVFHKKMYRYQPFVQSSYYIENVKSSEEINNYVHVNEKNDLKEVCYFSIHKTMDKKIQFYLHFKIKETMYAWLLPRGVSSNPSHLRPAFKVKPQYTDINFEGVIHNKHGNTTVMLWDQGEVSIKNNKISHSFTVHFVGKRLQGAYLIEKKKNNAKDNQWIIRKDTDRFANEHKNLTKIFTNSIKTDRTLKQITQNKSVK